ncbi:hypothetical protein GCM10010430_61010 [Kitasatospora cystarginea]|uniref:Uncharacterized protein n=1 Tax=Kitasatospora cystarginea TaxID=58350 RepID=A0ABP5RML6_9ACTN
MLAAFVTSPVSLLPPMNAARIRPPFLGVPLALLAVTGFASDPQAVSSAAPAAPAEMPAAARSSVLLDTERPDSVMDPPLFPGRDSWTVTARGTYPPEAGGICAALSIPGTVGAQQ